MKIYNYDHNGEFTSEGVADVDPLEGIDEVTGEPRNWLIPAMATFKAPPAAMPGNARVFRDGTWGYVKVSTGPEGDISDDPHGPDVDDVAAERNRRLEAGFMHDFGPGIGLHYIGTTPADMAGWDEVTKLANAYIMSGAPDEQIGIMTGTGPAMVSALSWQQVLIHAGQVRQPLFAASFALQAADPIPADYEDDKYWPVDENPPVLHPEPGKDVVPPNEFVPWLPLSGHPDNAPHNPEPPEADGPEEEPTDGEV